MQTVDISLLGAIRVGLDGQPIARFYSTKTLALLVYLAAESAYPHKRAQLTGLLWPESSQLDANRSLRQALFQLNKTLNNAQNQILLISNQQIQFNTQSRHWLDVLEFGQAIGVGALDQAVQLYRGPFLDGFVVANSEPFEEWVHNTRENFFQQAINALARLTQNATEQGDFAAAQLFAAQTLAHAPWSEEAHRALMLALALLGQRSAALAQFTRCQRILNEELGAAPEAETVQLYEQILRGALTPTAHPPEILLSPASTHSQPPTGMPQNLPDAVLLTPLVGRQSQLTQILSRVTDPHCRLLTLVGMGGMGKTRLAVEAARELAASNPDQTAFPDGIWFVPLLEAKTLEGAIGVVAHTLGITLYGERAIQEQVIGYLRAKRMLLILDNFEHLMSATDRVSALLSAAPGVKVLVTSQEALNLWEEWFFPVTGLSLPSPDTPEGEEIVQSPAVALFALNARRRSPSFQLEAEYDSVARICALVSGMPLAIELAASWLTRMSCRQIADQIEADLDFLATSAASIPERHRSIRAILDQTWELLSPEERSVLRYLSIFSGAFHQKAAQMVGGATLSLLGQLVEKTLLQVTTTDRYQMHDLVRNYARAKLWKRPQDRIDVLTRHSDFYLNFIAQRQEALFHSSRREVLAEVDQEFEHILSAWDWAAQHARFAQMDQAQQSLFAFCLNRGRYQEGKRAFSRLVEALAAPHADHESAPQYAPPIYGRALARQGFFKVSSGEVEQGMAALEQALVIARSHGNPADRAFCLTFLGEFEGWRGNFDRARQLLTESIAINETMGDQLDGGFALYRLGESTHAVGEFEQARRIFEECVGISRRIDGQDAIGYALD